MISWLMAVMTALLIVVICLLVFILALLCHVLSDYKCRMPDYKCRGTRFSAGPRKTDMVVGHQYWEDGGHRDARK